MHQPSLSVSIQVVFLLPLAAQSVTATTAALSPVAVNVTVSGVNTTNTQPIGPLAGQGSVQAQLGTPGAHAEGFVRWSTDVDATATRVWLSNVLLGDPGVPCSVSIPSHSFLVSFTGTPAGVSCDLELFHFRDHPVGGVLPRIDIDLDNDGAIDLPGLALGTTTLPLIQLGSQAKPVRIVMSAQLPGPGWSLTTFAIAARPHNNVAMTQIVSGCPTLYGDLLAPVQVFADRGIDFRMAWGEYQQANVYVIGLGQQPALLPPQGGVPCLLVPAPDILIGQATPLHIALPAIVRPVTFYVQCVGIGQPLYAGQSPYGTTDGFGVTAF